MYYPNLNSHRLKISNLSNPERKQISDEEEIYGPNTYYPIFPTRIKPETGILVRVLSTRGSNHSGVGKKDY